MPLKGREASDFKGAAFPCCEAIDKWHRGWLGSGVALRFGCRARESKRLLGLRVKQLSASEGVLELHRGFFMPYFKALFMFFLVL